MAVHGRNGDPPFRAMPKLGVGDMGRGFLEMFTEPLTEPPGKASRLPILQRYRHRQRRRVFDRMGDQSGTGCERGTGDGFRETADAQGPTHTNLFVENAYGEIACALKLAGAAGENHPATGIGTKSAVVEPRPDEFEGLLDARLNDAVQE